MTRRLLLLAALFLLPLAHGAAQQRTITGRVLDAQTGDPLQYAGIRVEGGARGTTTDKTGRFVLHLDPGTWTLTATYMGYASATQTLGAEQNAGDVVFRLTRGEITLPEVLVTPEDNPALEIIRQAIGHREKRREKLRNYSLSSHSKMVVTVAGESVRDRMQDSSVTAILESQTDAFWSRPDRYKEIIKARKQSSFLRARNNLMISAFFTMDFSQDVLDIGGRMVTGPISTAGLREYSYTLKGTTSYDGSPVYIIDIAPLDEDDPLLKGRIYIADNSFAPVLFDVSLNDAALPMMFRKLSFRQQFRLFEGEFWMPVDVVVSARAEISIIVNVAVDVEGMSVLQDYAINVPMNDDVFDRTVIKVLKEADDRDSTWWAQAQLIPNTSEELEQYRRADSLKLVFEAQRNDYGFGSLLQGKTFSLGDLRFSVPGLLDLYRFNRVEGHTIRGAVGIGTRDVFDSRLRSEVGYGFDSRRLTWQVNLRLPRFPFDGMSIGGGMHDRIGWIDEGRDLWSEGTATWTNLLSKYDPRDFFHSRGYNAWMDGDLTSSFAGGVAWGRREYGSVDKSTDWSILRQHWRFRGNPAINDGWITTVSANLRHDSRDFIDNAGQITRLGGGRAVDPRIGLTWHRANLGGRSWDITSWWASVRGSARWEPLGTFSWSIEGETTNGALPTQLLMNLPGLPEYLAAPGRFMTVDFREYGGDRRVMAHVEQDFGDYLFRRLGIPFLKSSGFGLRLFARAGLTTMTAATRALQTVPVMETGHPLYEAGFGITGILSILNLDCAWRLNHLDTGRNFSIGISTILSGGSVTVGL